MDYFSEIINEHLYTPYYGNYISTEEYINKIKTKAFYSGDLEISNSIYIFNINIAVYEKFKDKNGLTSLK